MTPHSHEIASMHGHTGKDEHERKSDGVGAGRGLGEAWRDRAKSKYIRRDDSFTHHEKGETAVGAING